MIGWLRLKVTKSNYYIR